MSTSIREKEALLFASIHTLNGYNLSQEIVDDMKRRFILEVRTKKLLLESVLSKPFVYVGAGLDIETPLLLGFSEITMLEVCYIYPEVVKRLVKKISVHAEGPVEILKTSEGYKKIVFPCCHRMISVVLIPESFQSEVIASRHGVKLWDFPKEIGMLFAFAITGVDFLRKEVYQVITPGGFIYSNTPPNSLVCHVQERKSQIFTVSDLKNTVIDIAKLYGYKGIYLEGDVDGHMFFYQKPCE